ncbi:VOC family protein [Aeribacillus composti]|uniref:VOC family protein n=1 Tax=Aeribacillus TaxID=1055323 RepID=UPI0007B466CB|nr:MULTISPECIES: VOC family protein [Aeribacillus]KZM57425.1 glyoxalase [Aeribacillus pallidus]MED0650274.1 VOC family protein [Aeribacillus composti]MED0714615.1 VOC family protein [Aeribacillus composti]MED0746967.1 VOC family protein [Aeribacillus composti]MED4485582.1 VOC family protein [Aeribacillus pallidus]
MELEFHRSPNKYIGGVSIKVEDLKRSIAFYHNLLGFKILEQKENKVVFSADGKKPLLIVEQPDNVIRKQVRTTGLYHFAILLPERKDLANALYHLIQMNYPLQGASDHLVSEAVYLADPDGNGIEIYADRKSANWEWNQNQVVMDTIPLDINDLFSERDPEGWQGMPEATIIGHVHLHVAYLDEAEQFYCKGLGFQMTSKYGSHALFISSGKYHHHIALNTWNGIGAPKPPENSVGLKWFTIILPNKEEKDQVIKRLKEINARITEKDGKIYTIDPSGNQIGITTAH